jgi:hypothetical protein
MDSAFLRILQSLYISISMFKRHFPLKIANLEESRVGISPLRGRGPAAPPALTRNYLEETKVGLLFEKVSKTGHIF